MHKFAFATLLLIGFCFFSCGLITNKEKPEVKEVENKIGLDVSSDSIQKQIQNAEAELKSFLEDKQ